MPESQISGRHNGDRIIWSNNHAFLDRVRVNELLETAIKSPLVVVTANSGYGKTRAIGSFLSERSDTIVWFSLTDGDNDRTQFWNHFVSLISKHNRRLSEKMHGLGFPARQRDNLFFGLLDDELGIAEKYFIVFDDFHVIKDKDVLSLIRNLVDRHYDNITVMTLSQLEPSPILMPLGMRHESAIITEDELCFTKQEIDEYFTLTNIPLSADEVQRIYDYTKGWAFAVSLFAFSMRKNSASFEHSLRAVDINIQKIIEFDVFSDLPENLQKYLVQLSLLEYLAPSLISTLEGGDELLREIDNISPFIRYDSFSDMYRIHHLFREFLGKRQDLITDDIRKCAYRKSAEWCVKNELFLDAIRHFEKAGIYDRIVETIYFHFSLQIPPRDAQTLLEIFKAAPEGAFDNVPLYPVTYTRILLSLGQVSDAIDFADNMVVKHSAMPESEIKHQIICSLYLVIGIGHLMLAPFTDSYKFDKYFERMAHHFAQFPYERANPGANPVSIHTIPPYAGTVCTTKEGSFEKYIGALERGVQYTTKSLDGYMAGMDMLAKGELCFFKGDLVGAEAHVSNAFAASERARQYDIRNRALFIMMRICLARGKYEYMPTVLHQLNQQIGYTDYANRQLTYDVVTSWFYTRIGLLNYVPNWIDHDFEEESISEYCTDFANLMKAHLLYHKKQYQQLLTFLYREGGNASSLYMQIDYAILKSLCNYSINNKADAFDLLVEAYELSRTNELIMPFIEYGKEMRTLTGAAEKADCVMGRIPYDWLNNINRRANTYAKYLNNIIGDFRKANGLDQEVVLTPREISILTELYKGLSRAEIAMQQGLSVNTIRVILDSIFEKLNARNSMDAIRIAAERNLL
ncbi:MAG: LuxR C-terminal-related transcriptional regulator [Clostridiales Family XIII bacterium]|jgi:LuxR family maltose regulon positive regulatory protein|nr:LuxR C-terminal-related transcriptional regulator [Clostridiales Family XIII bacterium]